MNHGLFKGWCWTPFSPPVSGRCSANKCLCWITGQSGPQAGGACWYFSFHQLCKSLSLFGLNASESGLHIYPRLFLAFLARGSAALWKRTLWAWGLCARVAFSRRSQLLKICLGLWWPWLRSWYGTLSSWFFKQDGGLLEVAPANGYWIPGASWVFSWSCSGCLCDGGWMLTGDLTLWPEPLP